ncbi:KGG domain-containing protein [Sorangium sp. So ce513]|uniref:KGG domain-containing protein n=1 Tax=Sorangium sp. So ce513 TaxID=3133315 RepID=UPI003F5DF14E
MGQSSETKRGFAAMNAEQQRQIASQGGKAAHEKGTAHEFTSEEARAAGRKGGEVVSQNREHMAAIGRKGAEARSQASNGARKNRGNHEQHVKPMEQPSQQG